MTTLHERTTEARDEKVSKTLRASDRREFRRHDIHAQGIPVERWDGSRRVGKPFGEIVDISAGGVRIRTEHGGVKPDHQIRVRLELPPYAGIHPFVDHSGSQIEAKREWIGWMAVSRVNVVDEKIVDVAGRLVDMDEMDRGMLGLYLSTQPLAA